MHLKNSIIVIVLLFLSINTQAQQQKNGVYFGLGITRAYFQDLEYAAKTHTNSGLNLRLGYNSRNESRIWNTGLELRGLIGGAFEQGYFQYTLHPTLHFSYLKNIMPVASGQLFLGGRVDLFDLNVFVNTALSNNAVYYFASSNIHLATEWHKPLNEKWTLHLGGSLALFGFTKDMSSYGFSVPQEMIDRGEFHYQNSDFISPFNTKYYSPKTVGDYTRIRTEVGLTSKKRSRFAYRWDFTRYGQTKDRPLTFGSHSINWIFFFGKTREMTPKI